MHENTTDVAKRLAECVATEVSKIVGPMPQPQEFALPMQFSAVSIGFDVPIPTIATVGGIGLEEFAAALRGDAITFGEKLKGKQLSHFIVSKPPERQVGIRCAVATVDGTSIRSLIAYDATTDQFILRIDAIYAR